MQILKSSTALLASADDIAERGFRDWIVAHTSFLKPLHRYEGEITMQEDMLVFRGKDKRSKQPFVLEIPKANISGVFHGFDDVFRRGEERSVGLTFRPLRITYTENGDEEAVYLITDFNRWVRTTNNKDWAEALCDWTGLTLSSV